MAAEESGEVGQRHEVKYTNGFRGTEEVDGEGDGGQSRLRSLKLVE